MHPACLADTLRASWLASLVLCCVGAVLVLCWCTRIVSWITSRCQAVCSRLSQVADALVASSWSVSALRPPRADRCCLPLSSSHALYLFCSYLPLCLARILLPLSTSQYLSVSLSNSVHLCSFPPRLAARSGLCSIHSISVPLCTLRESLASLSLAVVALAGSPRLLLRLLWGPIPYLGVYKVFDFKG